MDGTGFTPTPLGKRVGAGAGVYLEYWPGLHLPPQNCQVGLVVMPAQTIESIYLRQADRRSSTLIIQVHLDELEAEGVAQFAALPPNLRKTLIDPALLHLIQLLHQEMQTPQPMSQLLIASIVQVLINALILPEAHHERRSGFRF